MKKMIICLILSCITVLSACGKDKKKENKRENPTPAATEEVPDTESPEPSHGITLDEDYF